VKPGESKALMWMTFQPEPGLLTSKVSISHGQGDDDPDPYVGLARRRRLVLPEAMLLGKVG
jgi:hypothetical protein